MRAVKGGQSEDIEDKSPREEHETQDPDMLVAIIGKFPLLFYLLFQPKDRMLE